MTLIADAGGLLSVFDRSQPDHGQFVEAMRNAHGPIVVSPVALADLDYFILNRLGRTWQLAALEEIEVAYLVDRFTNEDLVRARALLARYADLTGFGLADASCVVLAERYDCFDILTTGQRDFRVVVGSRSRHFRILPYDV